VECSRLPRSRRRSRSSLLGGRQVAHGFEGDRRALRELGEEGADGTWHLSDPGAQEKLPVAVKDDREREVLARPGGLGQGAHHNRSYNPNGTSCTSCALTRISTIPVWRGVQCFHTINSLAPTRRAAGQVILSWL